MSLKDFLEQGLKTIREEEAREELQALKDRRFTLADLEEALDSATDEDRDRFKAALVRHGMAEEAAEEIVSGDTTGEGEGNGAGSPTTSEARESDPPPARKTRPGRRAGNAYAYRVDDEGRVVKSDTAVVYTGEDEPDEVELPE